MNTLKPSFLRHNTLTTNDPLCLTGLPPVGLFLCSAFCFSDGARTARGGATSTPRLYCVKAAACPLCGNGWILPNAPVAERRPLRGRQDPAFCLRPFHPSKKRNDWRCGLVFLRSVRFRGVWRYPHTAPFLLFALKACFFVCKNADAWL